MNQDQVYAEDINYWQSSRTSPDVWIEKTIKLIQDFGGLVFTEGYGSEPQTGRAAFLLGFDFMGEKYKVIYPVLESKSGNRIAAKIQAATLLYHDVKAKCLSARIFGVRAVFFQYLMLPDGRTVGQLATPEISKSVPARLLTEGRENEN